MAELCTWQTIRPVNAAPLDIRGCLCALASDNATRVRRGCTDSLPYLGRGRSCDRPGAAICYGQDRPLGAKGPAAVGCTRRWTTALVVWISLLGGVTGTSPPLLHGFRMQPPRMEYFEELPEQCPPGDATSGEFECYRLTSASALCDEDFHSHKKLGKWSPNVNTKPKECCKACAVSVWNSLDKCKDLLKLPSHRGERVIRVIIRPHEGPYKQTGGDRRHFSWWRKKPFCIGTSDIAYVED